MSTYIGETKVSMINKYDIVWIFLKLHEEIYGAMHY
jgi:hypothetical protein